MIHYGNNYVYFAESEAYGL